MRDKKEMIDRIVSLNESLTTDMQDLKLTLEKLNLSLHKLNLEYQWMRQEKEEKGEI